MYVNIPQKKTELFETILTLTIMLNKRRAWTSINF